MRFKRTLQITVILDVEKQRISVLTCLGRKKKKKSCRSPGDATFRAYIGVKITQGVNQYSTAATDVSDWMMVSRVGQNRGFDFCKEGMQNCLLTMRVLATTAFWVNPCAQQKQCFLCLGLVPPMERTRDHQAGCRRCKVLTSQLFKDLSHKSATCLSLGQAKLKYLNVFLQNIQELLKAD